MNRAKTNILVADMLQKYPTLNGWTFSYEYPGYFQYQKGDRSFCFTPDHDREGYICIQVFDDNGAQFIGGEDAKYEGELDADRMITLIKPELAKF